MEESQESAHVDKKLRTDEKRNDAESFIPRDYQIEIYEEAMKQNTIACLGTGTGKTFIAILLIRENADEVRISFSDGGKRIFFLVPTVPLVHQQAQAITRQTYLKVKGYCGEMGVDKWDRNVWLKEFVENEVLVMTAEIFKRILEHTFISPERIKLLIIDECHRARKDDPCRQALKYLSDMDRKKLPRIFGLSASLINGKCKPSQLEKLLSDLERTTMCAITTASDIAELQKFGTDPDEFIVYYSNYILTAASLIQKIDSFSAELKRRKLEDKEKKEEIFEKEPLDYNFSCFEMKPVVFFSKPLKCLNSLKEILSSLGSWCALKAAEIYIHEIEVLLLHPFADDYGGILKETNDFLKCFKDECFSLNGYTNEVYLEHMPHKLKRLLEIFSAAKKSKKFSSGSFDENLLNGVSFQEKPVEYHRLSKENLQSKNEIQLNSIIFVQQRITAYVLCEWLKKAKEVHSDLNFLKPDFIVGHGSIGTNETSMSEKAQKKKLEAFKKHECNVLVASSVLEEGMDIRQCNVVIRFDLPIDFRSYVQSKGRARAKNSIYVLMVQDKQDISDRFLQDLCSFKTIEKLLLSRCYKRALPTNEEISDNMADSAISPYMPYGVTGPRITMSSAISFINMYCSNLPSDMATTLVPRWAITKLDPNNIETEYICKLKMPINSPLRKTIESEPMRKKKLAKMSAALKTCQMLHDIGELNEDLVPKSNLVEKAFEEEWGEIEKEDGHGAQPGTNRRRQCYDKRASKFLQNVKPVEGRPCYLYMIHMKLINPLPKILNPRERPIIDPAETPRGLGLLCSSRLPPVNSFPLFTKFGKMLANVKLQDVPLTLTHMEIKAVEGFHRFLFADALFLEKGKEFLPNDSNSYYILPINKNSFNAFEIDWEFIKMVEKNVYHLQKKGQNLMSNDWALESRQYSEKLFKDSVLLRTYKLNFDNLEAERPTFHHVVKVENNMSPKSYIDSQSTENFKDYFERKYKVKITNDDQPLIQTVQYPSLHLWKPIYLSPKQIFEDVLSKSQQRIKNYIEYLVPELCIIHPFPSSFFLKVICIPTVLFRLNSLLLAEELRQSVAIATGQLQHIDAWPPFHCETSDKPLREYLFKRKLLTCINPVIPLIPKDIIKDGAYISSFEVEEISDCCIGPSPSLLLQALTTKSAGDEFDLERLEMIGDSFLKYVMSIKIYFKFPNFDEGKLTVLRSQLIQNLNLYQKAKKKGLPQFMITTHFSCNSTWLPPCYNIEEVVDEKTLIQEKHIKEKMKNEKLDSKNMRTKIENSVEKNAEKQRKNEETDQNNKEEQKKNESLKHNLHQYFTKKVISDKSVADCVEALIGAYLLTSGPKGALKFMTWLGLKPLVNENNNYDSWVPPPPDPFVPDCIDPERRLTHLIGGFEKFEKKIGYSFKNKAYLLQAFTHPSYCYNDLTDCYQRLEFLGDAILDYLITRQLYEDPNDHSPGKLTDLRSALVNNIFFASLAVTYDYHKFLKMASPELLRLMNQYIELLKDTEEFKFFEEHRYYLKEIECFELDEVEVPKALGDVFESVAGAIYLDSGMSLNAVWNIYFPMIKPSLDYFSHHVPLSPVRELYELVKTHENVKALFGKSFIKDEKTYIEVILPNGKTYEGVGPNKKVAKKSAAKRALLDIKNSETQMDVS